MTPKTSQLFFISKHLHSRDRRNEWDCFPSITPTIDPLLTNQFTLKTQFTSKNKTQKKAYSNQVKGTALAKIEEVTRARWHQEETAIVADEWQRLYFPKQSPKKEDIFFNESFRTWPRLGIQRGARRNGGVGAGMSSGIIKWWPRSCFFFFFLCVCVCWRLLLMAMDGSTQQMDNCWGAERRPT